MPVTKDSKTKTWCSQFYYYDWQGIRHKKNKRGFKTKGEAEEWEQNFRQQQQKDLDINFENFVEIYFKDMENYLRESTIINKRYVFDLKHHISKIRKCVKLRLLMLDRGKML